MLIKSLVALIAFIVSNKAALIGKASQRRFWPLEEPFGGKSKVLVSSLIQV